MKTKTITYKTNLKCAACVEALRPHLSSTKEVINWSIDIQNQDKLATIEMEEDGEAAVLNAFAKANFKAEAI